MKKILLTILILIVITSAALAVFVATFDANRYKSLIEEKIGEAIGRPVVIGSLSLQFKNGIMLQVDDFGLAKTAQTVVPEISFQADRFFLKLELAPLLKNEIQISECLLEAPKITVENTAQPQGTPTQAAAVSPAGSSAPAALPSAAVSDFYISRIKISDGVFIYRDIAARPPVSFLAEQLNLELTGVSLKSPILFKASGNLLLGDRKYFSAEGQFSYPKSSLELDARLEQAIQISGSMDHLFAAPSGTFKIKIHNLDLSSFLTVEQKRGEYFTGILSADFTASGRGSQAEDFRRSLNSAGFAVIESGALKNKNLLRENLSRITQIPGVGLLFESNLGPRFDALLNSPDTQFDRLNVNFRILNEVVTFQSIDLNHAEFSMGLKGSAGFDQTVNLSGSLLIGSALSEAMLKRVKELALISDAEGRIAIPFVLKGKVPGAVPQPDLGNLAARAVQTVGAELLEQGLTALLRPRKPSGSEPSPSQP